jgi:replicative DNA helicase
MADDFTALSHALPPQNVEAEESILGGILLDPEAMGRVADLLTPEAFYNSIHRRIYTAALTVHRQGKPTDLMTVTSWLQDQGELEGIGGTGTLAQLVDRTVSAVNIDRYATLIVDKYVRRQLIAASYEIAELGYDTTQELEQVLDQSEQKVFSLTQERPQQGLVHISESLIQTFEEIENQQDETTLPGLSCGFYDLDAMTSGFQRSDLVIIAGRPSMGKCLTGDTEIVLANGAVHTLADIYRHQTAELLTLGDDWRFHWTQPSVYVDDGIKPVFEVKTRTGRRIETTLSHPFLTIQGWRSLSHLTVGQKIAVPRHLPVFGTTQIPVEQIQSFVTPNLKTIPPVIFTLKKSQVALFLTYLFVIDGWAIVVNQNQPKIGYTTTSETLARQIQHLLLRFNIIARLKNTSHDQHYPVWQLDITDRQSCGIFIAEMGLFDLEIALDPINLDDPEMQAIATSDVYWDEIVAITPKGNKQVYDLTIPDHHNFVANDICVHNTSFALNVAANIAKIHQLPIAIFSLEMSKEQLAQRLLAGEAAVESNRLRSGRIDSTEMDRITAAIGTLSELPIYIDDSATLSVLQLRSQVRRLQAEKKGQIGVVLIDYLQLMEGTTDNRVQELSKMTRSLKGLAREVNAPVLVLSQLSRGVESRTNKRPMMSDLRECVTGDTLVWLADGRRVAIANLVGQMPDVISMNEHGRLIPAKADCVWEVGVKPVFELTTVSGRKIKATGKHRLYTFNGWQSVQALHVGDRLAVANSMPMLVAGEISHVAVTLTRACGDSNANRRSRTGLPKYATSTLDWDEIAAIKPVGAEPVYDLTVPGPASWLADGIVSHNSGSIEQDADLILMLYRDAYYNPDSPDRNVAEAIIVKHRNGPTGTVRLLFRPELTQFENLAGEM